MVLVITQHDLPEPRTDVGHAIVHPALKLSLDGFELRDPSLLRSDPPYGEGSALVALPTVVGKTPEGEGLWFSLSPRFPWLPCCLPPTRNEVGILIYGLFAAQ